MNQALPITVISAIVLFVIKEIIELFRKSKAKKRKLDAIKTLFKEEIELNLWAWLKFESLLSSVSKDPNGCVYSIIVSPSGTERFEFIRPDGGGGGQSFPLVRTAIYDKLVLDVAEADNSFYEKLNDCYKAIAELQHLRNGIVDFISEFENGQKYVDGFAGYALDELPKIHRAMSELYFYCTGEKLARHRMR